MRVKFDYPVSVIAGGNASGKSTVLFTAALRLQGARRRREGLRAIDPLFPTTAPRWVNARIRGRRSGDALNLLCEDSAAEGILRGVFDVLLPRERIKRESVRVGRDTGANEFPMHATAFRKFGQIQNFVFVLDGDKRNSDLADRIRTSAGSDVSVFFLPGDAAPESWIWNVLQRDPTGPATELGIDHDGSAAAARCGRWSTRARGAGERGWSSAEHMNSLRTSNRHSRRVWRHRIEAARAQAK